MKNICSVGALPDPDSSNYPELKCVLPLDSEFDFAGLKVFEGMKVDNIKPEKIVSSSPLGHSAQNDVYFLPKELVEKVAKLHFLTLNAEPNVPTQTQTRFYRCQWLSVLRKVVFLHGPDSGPA